MAYPRVGREFQLPLESSKCSIDQISALSSEFTTVLCIRTTGNRLHLRCFCKRTDPVTISSLQLSLPREASNQVISAYIVSLFPKLMINILTLAGTLITLDVSKFLVKGSLPEIMKSASATKRTAATVDDGFILNATKQVSLYDLSIGNISSSDKNAFRTDIGLNSNVKFEQHLPSSLTLELTLKLAVAVEDLGCADHEAIHEPSCILSSVKHRPLTEHRSLSVHPINNENCKDRIFVTSFIACSCGAIRTLVRQVTVANIYHFWFGFAWWTWITISEIRSFTLKY